MFNSLDIAVGDASTTSTDLGMEIFPTLSVVGVRGIVPAKPGRKKKNARLVRKERLE
jgi:hypothetical protein